MAILGGSVAVSQFYGQQPGYLTGAADPFVRAPAPLPSYAPPQLVTPSGAVDPCPVVIERNIRVLAFNYAASGVAAPHGFTERFRYVVPAGRRARVQAAAMGIIRETIAVGSRPIRVSLDYQGAHAAGGPLMICRLRASGAAAWDSEYANLASEPLLLPGDIITMNTQDPGTGTTEFQLSMSVREFDE